jgi:hypothetical protein
MKITIARITSQRKHMLLYLEALFQLLTFVFSLASLYDSSYEPGPIFHFYLFVEKFDGYEFIVFITVLVASSLIFAESHLLHKNKEEYKKRRVLSWCVLLFLMLQTAIAVWGFLFIPTFAWPRTTLWHGWFAILATISITLSMLMALLYLMESGVSWRKLLVILGVWIAVNAGLRLLPSIIGNLIFGVFHL